MPPLKYVGCNPAAATTSDATVVHKSYIDTRTEQLKVTNAYIDSVVASYAVTADLVTPAYVDNGDSIRASKAAVDAADALLARKDMRGAPNGVATLDAEGYVPLEQYPADMPVDRTPSIVHASAVYLPGEYAVVSTNTKAYHAATLTVPDPGFAYQVLTFAQVTGYCPGNPHNGSPRYGGPSRGKAVVMSGDDEVFAGGVTTNDYARDCCTVVPTIPAVYGAGPSVIEGSLTLNLWLSLYSGTSYVFANEQFMFCAVVLPAHV